MTNEHFGKTEQLKAVMFSIQPKYCVLIANGKKTVEVRKTRPQIPTPFKCYIYCTRAKEFISISSRMYAAFDELYRLPTGEIKFGDSFELAADYPDEYDENNFYNGKVIGEFICDEIAELSAYSDNKRCAELFESTCLTVEDICNYGDGKTLYFLHISDFKIYYKPKLIREFHRNGKPLTRAPQSWFYVEALSND